MRYLVGMLILLSAASIAFALGWLGQRAANGRGIDLDAWGLLIISVALGAGLLVRSAARLIRERPQR